MSKVFEITFSPRAKKDLRASKQSSFKIFNQEEQKLIFSQTLCGHTYPISKYFDELKPSTFQSKSSRFSARMSSAWS